MVARGRWKSIGPCLTCRMIIAALGQNARTTEYRARFDADVTFAKIPRHW